MRWDPQARRPARRGGRRLSRARRGLASCRTGYVSDREKVALMTGAEMLAYPSLLRGVRLPGARGVRRGAPGADVERVLAPGGDRRRGGGGGPARHRGDRRRHRSAVRRPRPSSDALRRRAHARVALHVGGHRAMHGRGVARRPRGSRTGRLAASVDPARPPSEGPMADPHVLVTGGAGFIGSHLVDALLERGDRVAVLDRLSAGGSLANLEHHGVGSAPDDRARRRPRPRGRRRASCGMRRPSCTPRPRRTSIAASTSPPRSSPRTCSAPRWCSTPFAATGCAC